MAIAAWTNAFLKLDVIRIFSKKAPAPWLYWHESFQNNVAKASKWIIIIQFIIYIYTVYSMYICVCVCVWMNGLCLGMDEGVQWWWMSWQLTVMLWTVCSNRVIHSVLSLSLFFSASVCPQGMKAMPCRFDWHRTGSQVTTAHQSSATCSPTAPQ